MTLINHLLNKNMKDYNHNITGAMILWYTIYIYTTGFKYLIYIPMCNWDPSRTRNFRKTRLNPGDSPIINDPQICGFIPYKKPWSWYSWGWHKRLREGIIKILGMIMESPDSTKTQLEWFFVKVRIIHGLVEGKTITIKFGSSHFFNKIWEINYLHTVV